MVQKLSAVLDAKTGTDAVPSVSKIEDEDNKRVFRVRKFSEGQ